MSASTNRESICSPADGFSFVCKDGHRYISIEGPCTAIPDTDIGQEASDIFFRTIYPDNDGMTILSDTIPELNVRILYGIDSRLLESIRTQYPDIPLRCHINDTVTDISHSDTDILAVVPGNGNAYMIALRDGRLLLFKQVSADTYKLLYNITKIWKELGFVTEKAKIRLYGLQDNRNLITGLKQMIGENTLCVL